MGTCMRGRLIVVVLFFASLLASPASTQRYQSKISLELSDLIIQDISVVAYNTGPRPGVGDRLQEGVL